MKKRFFKRLSALIMVSAMIIGVFSSNASLLTTAALADDDIQIAVIESVSAIGFMDIDGAKLSAIAVEYSADLTGADVSADDYELDIYEPTWDDTCVNNGDGEFGDVIAVYVNNAAEISETGGSGYGNYVIIEMYTEYELASEQDFESTMSVGITQTADITGTSAVAYASEEGVTNYTETQTYNSYKDTYSITRTANYGTYTISGIEGFKYYTDSTEYGGADGEPFYAEDCFNEQDGLYYDETLSYALYVPEDYDPNGSYALVTIENPAADEGTHPYESVLTTRSPSVFASEWAQELVAEEHGLDGIIVVVPVVTQRVNDNGGTPSQYEAIVKLWDYLIETYAIDENYIYGVGQSVGGMILLETNRNRDNFFAGIMMYENQWAQNYYEDGLFVRNMASDADTAATAAYHYPRTSSEITWDYYYDSDGNKVYEDHDEYNLYYLMSDDNVLIMNRSSNNLSNDTWTELSLLYSDLVGYEIEQFIVDATLSVEEQNTLISEYLNSDDIYNGQDMGLKWVTFENGINGYSARKVDAGYEWLLCQSREEEMSREKLDLNKPFELADEQIEDESRATHYTDVDGNTIYFVTGKSGSGTQFYNTGWYNLGTIADASPAWLPEGMSWEIGVEAAEIQDVIAINDEDGNLIAVAVEYNVDMENIYITLKGDEIIGLDGTVREDISIVLDPFDFYDEDGEQIVATISNVYVNSSASLISDAERGSGSGNFVIIEVETTSTASAVSVVQRTTIHTDTAIANATATVYSGSAASTDDNTGDTNNTSAGVSIYEIYGSNRYTTAIEIAEEVATGSIYAVVADGENYPDALTAASLAGALDATILLTSDAQAVNTVAELQELGVTNVYIVGGTSSVSTVAESAIDDAGITVERIAGSTRQQTALKIAEEVLEITGDNASDICIVAAGTNYPDALSVSGYAYYASAPIYLTNANGSISDEVLEAISGYSKVVIVGGTASVSESVEEAISSTGVSVERLSGSDRYETAKAIAAWSVEQGMLYETIVVATGTNFPDALAASALCGQKGAVMLLSATSTTGSSALESVLEDNADDVKSVYIVGGTNSVSESIRSMIKEVLGIDS